MSEKSTSESRPEALDECAALLRTVFPETHLEHRRIGSLLAAWAVSVERAVLDPSVSDADREYLLGYARALNDVVYHLTRGDALPGGPLEVAAFDRLPS